MIKHIITISLLLTTIAFAQGNPLVDHDFWKTATVADINQAIKNGANIEEHDFVGRTVLMVAITNSNDIELIKTLIAHGADIHERDEAMWTPLMTAVRYSRNINIIELFINSKIDIHAQDSMGRNAIMIASLLGTSPEVVQVLLENGADATITDDNGKNALDYAKDNKAIYGTKAYEMLLDKAYK